MKGANNSGEHGMCLFSIDRKQSYQVERSDFRRCTAALMVLDTQWWNDMLSAKLQQKLCKVQLWGNQCLHHFVRALWRGNILIRYDQIHRKVIERATCGEQRDAMRRRSEKWRLHVYSIYRLNHHTALSLTADACTEEHLQEEVTLAVENSSCCHGDKCQTQVLYGLHTVARQGDR